jgi:hypothetical protein
MATVEDTRIRRASQQHDTGSSIIILVCSKKATRHIRRMAPASVPALRSTAIAGSRCAYKCGPNPSCVCVCAGLARSEKFFGTSPVRMVDDVYNVTSVYLKVSLSPLATISLLTLPLFSHLLSANTLIAPCAEGATSPHVLAVLPLRSLYPYPQRGLDQVETALLEDPYSKTEPLVIKQGVAQAYQQLFASLVSAHLLSSLPSPVSLLLYLFPSLFRKAAVVRAHRPREHEDIMC